MSNFTGWTHDDVKAAQAKFTPQKKPKPKQKAQTESQIQSACVKWFRAKYPKLRLNLFSVPNGAMLAGDGKRRAMRWAILEREGAVAGASDLFLSVPSGDYCGFYIEMKRPGQKRTATQVAFQDAQHAVGYAVTVCTSLEAFIEVTTKYFNGETI